MTLPAGYAVPTTIVDPSEVGVLYHLAIGTKSTAGLAANDRIVGFMLANKQGSKFSENTDLHSKEALTQYASQNLIDRDLVNNPRVTQGRWDLGFLQTVLTDPARYMDSDLETSVPGYLFLKPQWLRSTKAGINAGAAPTPMVVAWNGDFWFTFAESNKNVYAANGGTTLALPIVAQFIDSDGTYLYFSDGTNIYRRTTAGANTQIVSAVNGGPILQMWVIQQGTNGYFVYYLATNGNLYKVDVSGAVAFPVPVGSQPQVALGSTALTVIDVKPYGTAVAILTADTSNSGFTVWTHDGVNLTPVISVPGYHGHGMTVCLGDLYVAGHPHAQTSPAILARVGPGSFDIIAEPGSPFPVVNQSCLAPISSSKYVYWPIISPSIQGVSAALGYIVRYNVITGEATHLPVFDATDFTGGDGSPLRRLAALGSGVGCAFINGTNGILQYEVNAFGTVKYMASGKLQTSRIDFATPSIAKLLRRCIATHRPLNAGESIQIDAYVDKDPLTQALGAPDATSGPNTTVGSTTTIMSFASGTLGKSVFFVVTLSAGTNQLTTPILYQYAVEAAPGWVWKFIINCYHNQETLQQGRTDDQGMTGRDKYWFLHEIQEFPPPQITLYHPNQLAYNGVFEQINFEAKDPHFGSEQDGAPDLEFEADCIFRWTSE